MIPGGRSCVLVSLGSCPTVKDLMCSILNTNVGNELMERTNQPKGQVDDEIFLKF